MLLIENLLGLCFEGALTQKVEVFGVEVPKQFAVSFAKAKVEAVFVMILVIFFVLLFWSELDFVWHLNVIGSKA